MCVCVQVHVLCRHMNTSTVSCMVSNWIIWEDAKIIKSHSSEKFLSPILYPSQIPPPKYFKHSLTLFLSLFICTFSCNTENILQYLYANFSQLESKELQLIVICEKPDGEQAVLSWFWAPLPTALLNNWTVKALCQRDKRGGLTVWIHSDEHWSKGDLFRFN